MEIGCIAPHGPLASALSTTPSCRVPLLSVAAVHAMLKSHAEHSVKDHKEDTAKILKYYTQDFIRKASELINLKNKNVQDIKNVQDCAGWGWGWGGGVEKSWERVEKRWYGVEKTAKKKEREKLQRSTCPRYEAKGYGIVHRTRW